MTNRIYSNGGRRAAPRRRPAPGRSAAPPAQQRRLVQLVICGSLFVLLVALKFLFPQGIAAISQTAGDLLGQNADFRAAFSAVGRAIAGEEPVSDSLQEAYTAVFAPGRYETAPSARNTENLTAAADRLHMVLSSDQLPHWSSQADSAPEERSEEPEKPVTDEVSSSYVYFSMPLPEKASMDLVVFSFPHTSPIQGTMTSAYGWREHPVYGGDRFHYGLDMAAASGTTIAAFASGTVRAVGKSSVLGNYLMIDHPDGLTTTYAHCRKITVKEGAQVDMGQKVAEVGSTGNATGPHLHFTIQQNGIYLNPIYYVELR